MVSAMVIPRVIRKNWWCRRSKVKSKIRNKVTMMKRRPLLQHLKRLLMKESTKFWEESRNFSSMSRFLIFSMVFQIIKLSKFCYSCFKTGFHVMKILLLLLIHELRLLLCHLRTTRRKIWLRNSNLKKIKAPIRRPRLTPDNLSPIPIHFKLHKWSTVRLQRRWHLLIV